MTGTKMVGTREHDELLRFFERRFSHMRLDREPVAMWPRGVTYQDGQANELYKAFFEGYAFGKSIGRQEGGES